MAQDKASIVSKAQRFAAKGQIDKAIREWQKIVVLTPTDGNTHNIVGDLFLRKGEKEKAVDSFQKAAGYFRDQGFALKAMALYKKILNLDPMNTGPLLELAELNAERGLVGNANENYLSAAEICIKNKEIDKAVKLYEKIMLLSPTNFLTHLRIADLFVKIGLKSEAVRVYGRTADGFLERGEEERAEKIFNRMVEIDPSSATGHVGLSRLLSKRGDSDEALAVLEKAAQKHPESPEITVATARVEFSAGRTDHALEGAERVVADHPGDTAALRLCGEIYLALGQSDDAWGSLNRAVEELVSQENYREAVSVLTLCENMEGRRVEVLRRLATLERESGQVDRAVVHLKGLGNLLGEQGRRDEAIRAFDEARSLKPGDEEIEETLRRLAGITSDKASEEASEEAVTEDSFTGEHGDVRPDGDSGESAFDIRGYQEIGLGMDPDGGGGEHDSEAGYAGLTGVFEIPETPESAEAETAPTGDDANDSEISKEKEAVDESAPAEPADGDEAVPKERAANEVFDEDLAEADFYLEQGLQDEAIEIFQRLVSAYPDRPEPRERLAGLLPEDRPREVVLPGSGGSKTDMDTFFASISDTEGDAQEDAERADAEVASIFDAFKKGVAEEVEEGDFETHYNLGIAYKEMGLLEDAIRELQIATRVESDSFQASSMLAMCYLEQGAHEQAVFGYRKLMESIPEDDERRPSVLYDLAVALEKSGDAGEAGKLFRELYDRDAGFRDVAERVKNLE